MNIPPEFFTDVTLSVGDICGDDVRDNWSKSGSDMPSALVVIIIVIMMQGSSC